MAADETLRIQAVFDPRQDALLLSLLDMRPDWRGSRSHCKWYPHLAGLQRLGSEQPEHLGEQLYAGLKSICRNDYGGRLVDVLKVA